MTPSFIAICEMRREGKGCEGAPLRRIQSGRYLLLGGAAFSL